MSLQPTPGSSPPRPIARGSVRIGDVERDLACRALSEHFSAGRLTGEEFDQRVEAAVAARTEGDLRQRLADLPTPAPPVPVVQPASAGVALRPISTFDVMFGLLAGAAFMCLILLFMVTGERFAALGFFVCLGSATVAAAVVHFIHRSLADRSV